MYSEPMKKTILDPLSPAASRAARQIMPVFACCGLLALFAGCATEPESHLLSAPPPPPPAPAVVTTTTMTTPVVLGNPAYGTTSAVMPAVNTIVIAQAPPALQQEIVLAQPTPQHVWLAGYWSWRDSRYQWMAGRWELPPSSSSVWVGPRWEQQGNAYKFYEGYWN